MKIKYWADHIKFPLNLNSLNWPVKLISIIMGVYSVGWAMIHPFFPLYLKSLFQSYSNVGIMTGMLAVLAWVWAIMLGPMLDRLEKRRIINAILLLYLPFSYILLQATSFIGFMVFRVYHSFLATSLWLSSETYLRQHSQRGKESEAVGLYDGLAGLAQVVFPVVGGYLLVKFGFSVFYAVSAFALLAFFLSLKLPDHGSPIKDGLKFMRAKLIWKECRDYFSNKAIVRLSAFTFILGFTMSFISMTLPLYMNFLGASMVSIGIVYGLYGTPMLLEPYFSTFKKKELLIVVCVVSAILLCAGLFLTSGLLAAFILTVLLGIVSAAMYPAIFGRFTKIMPKGSLGKFSAVNYSMRQLAAGLGPIAAGFIADAYGLNYLFLLGAALFAAMLAIRPKDF